MHQVVGTIHSIQKQHETDHELNHNVELDDLLQDSPTSNEKDLGFTERLLKETAEEKSAAFEDGRITRALYQRMQMIDLGCLTMTAMGFVLIIFQYDLEFYGIHDSWSETLLYFIFLTSLVSVLLTVVRYKANLKFLKKRHIINDKETLFTTGEIIPMLFEILLCLLVPYPWLRNKPFISKALDDGSELEYRANDILCMFSILRLLLVLRVYVLESYYNSNRAQRLCEMYAVQPGMLFTIKCAMKKWPFGFTFSAYLLSIPFFGWMLRIAERPFSKDDRSGFVGYDYINSMWNVIITMTTVGYGDYFPRTYFGRAVIFFVCIWGTMIISFMVVTITNIFELDPLEAKTFGLLERLEVKETLRKQAADVVTNIIRGKKVSREKNQISEDHLKNAKVKLKQFKATNRAYKELSNDTMGFEDMANNFETLLEKVDNLMENQNHHVSVLKKVMGAIGGNVNELDKLTHDLKKPERSQKKRTTKLISESLNEVMNRNQRDSQLDSSITDKIQTD